MTQSTEQYERAFELVDMLFATVPDAFGCTVDELTNLGYVDAIISYYEEIETIIPRQDAFYHVVSDSAARSLYFNAQSNPDVYDVLREICTRNLLCDAPLPFLLRQFIVKEINGDFERTKRRGPPPSKGFALRAYIFTTANFVADATGLPLTRNVASNLEYSACDAIVDVAPRHGLELEFTTVRDWCLHKDYRRMRDQASRLNDYAKDLYLRRIGVLRRKG